MGLPQHRATEVAKTLSLFIKADLAEGLLTPPHPPQIPWHVPR